MTGASGFIGSHLIEALQRNGTPVRRHTHNTGRDELADSLRESELIFHLAGVNRPQNEGEYATGNAELTRDLCNLLRDLGRTPTLVLSSSVQAVLDNAYGRSKRQAEEEVHRFAAETGAAAVIFRLKNAFGKWCRPNYNSVVATLCHNIARGLPVSISDPTREVSFVYIDDVIASFLSILHQQPQRGQCEYVEVTPSYTISLGELVRTIYLFAGIRESLTLPDFADRFTRCLYATYVSYLEKPDFAYPLQVKQDNRGELAEFLKSEHFGQIFVSRTKPGAVRGNHYHHTKIEKFLVLEGDGVVRFRDIRNGAVLEYPVSGREFRVIDIPPGYTHCIENVGHDELVVLFWASEVFDPAKPDTYAAEVSRK